MRYKTRALDGLVVRLLGGGAMQLIVSLFDLWGYYTIDRAHVAVWSLAKWSSLFFKNDVMCFWFYSTNIGLEQSAVGWLNF